MLFDNVFLAGIGATLPARTTTADAVEHGWYDAPARVTGGLLSTSVAGDRPAPDLAVDAARAALRAAGTADDDVVALFHSSVHYQGPDGWSAHHYILRRTLGTPVPALELRQGCNGMLAGLQLGACHLAAATTGDSLLLTAADNFGTPVVDRWRTSELFVLGDGGAAVVLSTRPGFARLVAAGSQSNPGMEELHRGGEVLFPPAVTVGRAMDLQARLEYWRRRWAAGETPPQGHMGDIVSGAVKQTLDEAGLSMVDIVRVAHVHFAREALRHMYLDPLGIDEERGTWEFGRRVGHVGAVDAVAGLRHLWLTGAVGPGDHVLLIGATPGMEAGCAVVQVLREPDPAERAGYDDPTTNGR